MTAFPIRSFYNSTWLLLAGLTMSLIACNRHEVLPAARCRFDSDCVPHGRCTAGFCRNTARMDVSVTYTKIFRKSPEKSPLVVEMVMAREGKHANDCSEPFSIRKVFPEPSWPIQRTFKNLPDGKYAALAFLDMNGNGRLDRGEIAASNVCFAQTPEKGTVSVECELPLLYPF
jgi:hypothetical protein